MSKTVLWILIWLIVGMFLGAIGLFWWQTMLAIISIIVAHQITEEYCT
jgi:hypothetical protein